MLSEGMRYVNNNYTVARPQSCGEGACAGPVRPHGPGARKAPPALVGAQVVLAQQYAFVRARNVPLHSRPSPCPRSPLEVAVRARAGERREGVVEAHREPLFREIRKQCLGERHRLHAAAAGRVVDRARLGVTFVAQVAQHRQVHRPGADGVHVQVASQRSTAFLVRRLPASGPCSTAGIQARARVGFAKLRKTRPDARAAARSRDRHLAVA